MHVKISAPKVIYEFDLHRRITVLKGESGSGKSLLADLVQQSGNDVVSVQSARSLVTAPLTVPGNIDGWLTAYPNSVIIIDEDSKLGKMPEFYRKALDADCWILLISRGLDHRYLHYSVNEVYEIHQSGKYYTFKPYYRLDARRYDKNWPIVTEDSMSGFQFFNRFFKSKVSSLGGRDAILKRNLPELYRHTYIMDGAAFGQLFDIFYNDYLLHKLDFVLLESFEWALLKSSLFYMQSAVQKALNNPEEFGANDVKYDTWENFFEDYLNDRMHELGTKGYSKSAAPNCFISECCYRSTPCDLLKDHPSNKAESILKLYGYSIEEEKPAL